MKVKKIPLASLINYGLLTLIFVIASLPLLQFGFNGDDIYNSLIQGKLELAHKNLWQFTKEIILNWFHVQGRFFPIPFIVQYSLFYLTGANLLIYNFIHWTGLIIAIFFSAMFFNQILEKKFNTILFCCLFPFCWSLIPNSFLVCQSLLMPLVISFSMITLIFYVKFLYNPKTTYLLYLSFFYLLALLTYEVALVVPAVLPFINKKITGKYLEKKHLFAMMLIFLSTLGYLLLTLVIRHYSHLSYNGTSFGDINKIPLTFLIQLVGELPFISIYLLPKIILPPSDYLLAVFLFLITSVLIYRALDWSDFPKGNSSLFLISITLQLVPALLIALSKGYQNQLFFGVSHVPVFFQQIGFCMMLTLIVMSAIQLLQKSKKLLYFKSFVSIVISLIVSFSFLFNQAWTNLTNTTLRYPREVYEKALNMQLLTSLPKNATVVKHFMPGEAIWNSRELRAQLIQRADIRFFDLTSGRPANTDLLYDSITFAQSNKEHLYYLDFNYLADSPKAGYVLLAKIKKPSGEAPDLDLELDKVKLYYNVQSSEDSNKIISILVDKYPGLSISALTRIAKDRSAHSQILDLGGELNYHLG